MKKKHHEYKDCDLYIDSYAAKLDLIYALNNEFSLQVDLTLKNKNSSYDNEIETTYRKILQLEGDTGIKNFFPQVKYLHYLTERLSYTYSKQQALESVQEFKAIIKKCEEIFETYTKNINWTEKNLNYVFQLPYEECVINFPNANFSKVFIASSFVLPLPQDKYKSEFEVYKSIVNSYKFSTGILENIEKKVKSLENSAQDINTIKTDAQLTITQMKEEAEKGQTRAVEIIGIFSAIVTFVVGSLPTFKYIKTPCDAFMFMLALSSSLILFIILIIAIFRRSDEKIKHKYIYIFVVVVLLSWCGVFILKKCGLCNENNVENSIDTEDNQSSKNEEKINLNNTINISNKQPINKVTTKPPIIKPDTCRPKGCPPCPDCSKINNTSK